MGFDIGDAIAPTRDGSTFGRIERLAAAGKLYAVFGFPIDAGEVEVAPDGHPFLCVFLMRLAGLGDDWVFWGVIVDDGVQTGQIIVRVLQVGLALLAYFGKAAEGQV